MSDTIIFDTFPFHDELDMLECRLTELEGIKNLVHVLVEADVTHQDKPKPYYYADNIDRFEKWRHRIISVKATGMPTIADDPDPWSRETAQREYTMLGLGTARDQDVILHGDVDEIPRALFARNCRPGLGMVAFGQRGHFWAVDWLYPPVWLGTVATTFAGLKQLGDRPFNAMRNARGRTPNRYDDAGWHLSWLGGVERAHKKVGAFCHPEVKDQIKAGLDEDLFYRKGWHVDGLRMEPVDVDESWPKWIVDGNAPANWFRPR